MNFRHLPLHTLLTYVLCVFCVNAIESGDYSKSHEIGTFSGGDEMTFVSVTNTLSVTASESEIYFDIKITAANYHSCQLSGTAIKVTNHYEYHENIKYNYLGEKTGECILEFHEESNGILLIDKELICLKKYCGARGGFNGERFKN